MAGCRGASGRPFRGALAAEFAGQGHKVSADTVGDLLREEGFSLQAGAKTVEGKQHPDRDAHHITTCGGAVQRTPSPYRGGGLSADLKRLAPGHVRVFGAGLA